MASRGEGQHALFNEPKETSEPVNKADSILVTGSTGLVGGAIVRALKARGFSQVWDASHKTVDFENQDDTNWYFDECKPDYVFHCAAKVGGIADNIREPATFLTVNLDIQNNVICAAHEFGVKKLLFLASAACYPDSAKSPLSPCDLLTGPFDETKSGYAMAKLTGIQLCKAMRTQFGSAFISAIPNNIYGPGDRSSHVIPDLIKRFHEAKKLGGEVTCWGTGNARREFIHCDDIANACLFLMDAYDEAAPVNIGVGEDWSIREVVEKIASAVEFSGAILWDPNKPEGTSRRLLDNSKLLGMGWKPTVDFTQGLREAYLDFLRRA